VIEMLDEAISALHVEHPNRVGIDARAAAGKTTRMVKLLGGA
jgi:hypothetical protein